MQSIEEASRALNDLLDETPDAVRCGDFVIDQNTGEILSCPDGAADRMEALVMRDLQARLNIDGWEQIRALMKKAIGRLLDEQGIRSFATPYGRPAWMPGRRTESVDTAAVLALMKEREMGDADQLQVFRNATKTLNPKRLRECLAECEELITVKEGQPYIMMNPPAEAPPEISHE